MAGAVGHIAVPLAVHSCRSQGQPVATVQIPGNAIVVSGCDANQSVGPPQADTRDMLTGDTHH